ncbi:S1 family peptidase [Streptomyces krungchingensis]
MVTRGSRGIDLPSERDYPDGPRRRLLEALHVLYRAADTPGVRVVSEGLAAGDFRATMNRDLVAKVLSGRQWPTAYQLDSLVRWFAERAVTVRDPEQEAARFHELHEQAAGDTVVKTRPAMTVSTRPFVRISGDSGTVGAGVLLGNGHVLTRAHVVDSLNRRDESAHEPILVVPADGTHSTYEASVVWRIPHHGVAMDDEVDLALLSFSTPLVPTDTASVGQPHSGEAVKLFGYPEGYDAGVWREGVLVGQAHNNWWQVQVRGDSELGFEGYSGAAVLNPDNVVVGIVAARSHTGGIVWITSFLDAAAQLPRHFGS